MKRGKFQVVVVTCLSILAFGCSSRNDAEKTASKKYVKIEKVSNGDNNSKLVFNGNIKEKRLTTLSSRVPGPLVKLNVNIGDFVHKGQVIASIDKRDYELQVKSTKAQYKQIEGEYSRYKELYHDEKVPANSFEKIESGYLMAKTAYENAINQLQDTDIKAPFSGYIHEKLTENHQTIGAGQAIVSIIDVSCLEVVISVPENQIAHISKSAQNFLNVKNADVSQLPISILSISEKAKADGMFEVNFSFKNNTTQKVLPGMSAEVTILCNNSSQSIRIPSSAVFSDGAYNCVWLFDANTKMVSKKAVKLNEFASNGEVNVISGLKVGDNIVSAGVNYISEGQMVEPMNTPSKTNIGELL